MTAATYKLECDFNNNGIFTDASEDITADCLSIEADTGRDYASALTGRATGGKLIARLKNRTGTYSSFNASSPIYGNILPGRPVRLRTTAPSAVTLWQGFLDRIEPQTIGGQEDQIVVLTALGPLTRLHGKRVNPAANAGALTGTIIGAILDDAAWPAGSRTIDAGQTTTSRWFVQDKDAINALREIEETEFGFLYEGVDGKLIYEDRFHRLKTDHLTSQATFSDAAGAALFYENITQRDPLVDIYNQVRITVHYYLVAAVAVLWTLFDASNPVIPPGVTTTWWADYPNPAAPAGRYVDAWTTPDATDVTVTGAAFADLGITVSKFATSMKIAIKNNHATTDATITLLRARGTAVSEDTPTTVEIEDATSQTAYGERTYAYPGPWLANSAAADSIARYILRRQKDPHPILSFTIPGHASAAMMTQALTRLISDRITLVGSGFQTQLGISGDFFIERIAHRIDPDGMLHWVTYDVSDALADAGYWILGTSTLGVTTALVG